MTLAAPTTHGGRVAAHGAPGKPAAGENAAPGGAFSALMSALGDEEGSLQPADPAAVGGLVPEGADTPVADAGVPDPADPSAMAGLLAQSGLAGWTVPAGTPAPDGTAAGVALTVLAPATASPAQPAACQAPAARQASPASASTPPGLRGAPSSQDTTATDAPAAQLPLGEPRASAQKPGEQAQGPLAVAGSAGTHASHGTSAQDPQQLQRAQALQQEARLLQPLSVAATQASPQAELQGLRDLLAGSAPVGPARSERRSSERGNAGAGASAEGLMAGQTAAQAVPTYSVTPAAPLPEGQQFSEQVRYWIANDVQNARMQLDGLGDTPVEVNISLHGNLAHVAFRSDELQARSLLEAAGGQLKDMLQREGVVLAGVSVGTSTTSQASPWGQSGQGAGQGAAAGQRRTRAGQRAMQGVASVSAPAQPHRGSAGAGRSVDLFV